MFSVEFQYAADGPFMSYQKGYATRADAEANAAWVLANGFWYSRPLDPAPRETPMAVHAVRVVET